MAIIGGAGNPVGGSFTGPAQALEIIGDHAYAYSGIKASSATPTAYLSFTTGNYYFVGNIEPQYFTSSGNDVQFFTQLNGTTITSVILNNSTSVQYTGAGIVIPPYTQVEVLIDNLDGGTSSVGVTIAGRIYRTRD